MTTEPTNEMKDQAAMELKRNCFVCGTDGSVGTVERLDGTRIRICYDCYVTGKLRGIETLPTTMTNEGFWKNYSNERVDAPAQTASLTPNISTYTSLYAEYQKALIREQEALDQRIASYSEGLMHGKEEWLKIRDCNDALRYKLSIEETIRRENDSTISKLREELSLKDSILEDQKYEMMQVKEKLIQAESCAQGWNEANLKSELKIKHLQDDLKTFRNDKVI